MSDKPICRVQFTSEDEYYTIIKVATQHDQKLPEFVRNCVIKTVNEIFAAAEQQAKAAADAAAGQDAETEASTTEPNQDVEVTTEVTTEMTTEEPADVPAT